jgi:hypothetical protein
MVKDATADYSDKEMHAALDINIPNYASAIVTANEVVDSISSLCRSRRLLIGVRHGEDDQIVSVAGIRT